jgi:hypothetical protein
MPAKIQYGSRPLSETTGTGTVVGCVVGRLAVGVLM